MLKLDELSNKLDEEIDLEIDRNRKEEEYRKREEEYRKRKQRERNWKSLGNAILYGLYGGAGGGLLGGILGFGKGCSNYKTGLLHFPNHFHT